MLVVIKMIVLPVVKMYIVHFCNLKNADYSLVLFSVYVLGMLFCIKIFMFCYSL